MARSTNGRCGRRETGGDRAVEGRCPDAPESGANAGPSVNAAGRGPQPPRASLRSGLGPQGPDEVGQGRVRQVALGQDRAAVGRRRRRPARAPPTAGSSQAKPSSSRAVVLVRDEVERARAARGRGSRGRRPAGIVDPVVGAELARLDERPVRRPASERPDVDEGDERPAGGDDPVVELAPVEVEPAQDAGGRRRQVGLDERARRPRRPAPGRASPIGARPPQLAERSAPVGVPDDRPVADAGQRRRRGAGGRSPRPVRGGRDRSDEPRGVVGQRLGQGRSGSPDGSGVGSRTRPARRRRRPRPRSTAGTSRRPSTSTPAAREDVARPVGPRHGDRPLTTWWIPAMRVAGRGARRSPRRGRRRRSAIRHSSPTTRSGSPRPRRPLGGGEDLGSGSRCPGGPNSQAVRTMPSAGPRRPVGEREAAARPLAGRACDAPYGLPGAGRVVGPVAAAVGPPAVEDLVGRDRRRGRCPRRRAGLGQRRRRRRRCGAARAPGRGRSRRRRVQAAAWTTTSGRSRSSTRGRRPPGASRSKSARSQAIGPAGPVNGASASARDERPAEPPAGPGDGDAHQSAPALGRIAPRRSRSTPASRAAVLALVVGVPVARLGRPATRPRWRGTSRRSRRGPPRSAIAGRQPSAASFAPSIA